MEGRERDIEKVEEDGERASFLHHTQKPKSTKWRWLDIGILSLLCLSICLNILTHFSFNRRDLDDICSVYTSESVSPIQQDTKVKYSTIQFEGSFSNPNSSVFRLPPGQEVDDAWLSLGVQNHHYVVPEHLAEKFGLNPGLAKVIPELGGGFPVLFEFEHHLHCLNLLRQSSYWAYQHYKDEGKGVFGHPEEGIRQHVNHCTDMLRQQLMCQPDTGVFGQYWIKSTNELFVDFNTKHKCKNFWELKDWAVSHQVDPKKFRGLEVRQRPGDIVLDEIP